jgi:hypothetical protein
MVKEHMACSLKLLDIPALRSEKFGTLTLCEIWGLPGRQHRCRWNDDIERYLKETDWHGMDWIQITEEGDQWCSPANRLRSLLVP